MCRNVLIEKFLQENASFRNFLLNEEDLFNKQCLCLDGDLP